MKKLALSIFVLLLSTNLFGNTVSKEQCDAKGEKYIFAGQECIQLHIAKGEKEGLLNIVVHGTWKKGTNTLARYAPFADDIAMQTDVTTVAVALPGYSNSSSNHLDALAHEGKTSPAATKEYIEFLSQLVQALKNKFHANSVTYIGHSAGAMMGATLTGYNPGLINNIVCAGGRYDIHKVSDTKGLISLSDFMDKVNKNTRYILVYGTKDTISKPEVTKEFYKEAKANGMNVTLVEVKGAPHLDLDMSEPSMNAIVKLYEE